MKPEQFYGGRERHLPGGAAGRRIFTLVELLVLIAITAIMSRAPLLAAQPIPVTGQAVPELSAFDTTVTSFMQANSIKGGVLVIMKDGRLVLKHGYGWSDKAQTIPFDPDARVRIASNSKTFTAAAIKVLIERGVIAPNTLAAPFTGIQPYNGRWGDARLADIQVQHLVAHSGGLDSIQDHFNIWTILALDQPATAEERVSYMFSRPLQFAPGTRSAYSTEAYLLLGRVIEKASHLDYTTFVQRHVARTWGIPGVQLDRTEPKLRPADEPWYDPSTSASGPDLAAFPTTVKVPAPDGAENYYESFDSAGELITSVQGLVTFAQACLISNRVDGHTPPTAGLPIAMNGDRRRYRHLGKLGAQGGWQVGARSFNLQNTNGIDLAIFVNREIQEPAFGDFVAQLKRLTETTTAWPGNDATEITLAADSFIVGEEEGELVIGVRRTGDSQGVVSVNYATVEGTAQAGTDFVATVGTLTFADDEITQTIIIPISNNTLVDGDRTFTVGLSNAAGGAELGIATATITIEDDDALHQPPTVQILTPATGDAFSPGADLVITIKARAGSRAISKVEYFAGPTLLGEENKPPYTFTWKNPGTGSYRLTARVTDDRGLEASSSPVVVHVQTNAVPGPAGGVLREFWTRRPAFALATLTNYVHFPTRPTGWEYLQSFEAPTNWGDYYGSRLRGYLAPPITGAYVFWIAANDRAELWLSGDEREETKRLIASVNVATAPRQWDSSPTQQSQPVQLEAGRRYYVEALHKEATGPDHLAVGWQLPSGELERPIPGERLRSFILPVSISLRVPSLSLTRAVLTLEAAPGFDYTLEGSNNLMDWLSLHTNTATSFTLEFEDTEAATFPRRFHRARLIGP